MYDFKTLILSLIRSESHLSICFTPKLGWFILGQNSDWLRWGFWVTP